MLKINFGELRVGDLGRKYIQEALDSNWVSGGPLVAKFEQQWSEKLGYKHSIATSSGTDAGTAMCFLLYDFGANRGDEIICPASCFVSVANSILAAGFTPKFVDIDPSTLNIDPKKIEEKITEKTKAVKVVHNMGKPCDMDEILKICKKHNLYLLEDCCESPFARYKGQITGTFGLAGSCSFYAAHLVVCGEGGIVATNDDKAAEVLASIKTHGRKNGELYFDFTRMGLNFKMNDMEAAIGLDGMSRIDETFNTRHENSRKLRVLLSDLKDKITLFEEEPHEVICPHAFPMLCKGDEKDRLYEYLEKNGVQCKTLFGSLATQHNAFKFLGYKLGDFPVSEYINYHGLHFGIHQYLTEEHLNYLSDLIHNFYN